MIKLLLLMFPVYILSCQSRPALRGPSSEQAEENTIDPKFEKYEGDSFEAESEIHDELIKASFELMSRMKKESSINKMTRDAHAKSHGCLKASFEVDTSALKNDFKVGLFRELKKYEAWVRFSNNDHLPIRRDNEFDLRGMAIKVMGVKGQKILNGFEDAPTQDFLMYGSNVFFVANNKDYVGFIKGLRDDNAAFALVTQQPLAAIKTLKAQWKMSDFINPANMPYHSATPVRLGLPDDPQRTAMKYRAIPCYETPYSSPFSKNEFNYFRENLKSTLNQSDVCFLFQIQTQTHPDLFPIEDATVPWPEEIDGYANSPTSKYLTAARVVIPAQSFDTQERDEYCENLSFTPWHALVEHKPLGRTMRMRRDLYRATSIFRHQNNGKTMLEPAEFEIK